MWQRKQTVFLVLAAGCLILMIFFPVWTAGYTNPDGTQVEVALYPLHFSIHPLSTNQQMIAAETNYLPYSISAILAIAAATLAIIEIGKFNNRLLQIKMGALNALLMVGTMGSSVYFAISLIKTYQLQGSYGLSLFLPAVAMVSNTISNWMIRRDEKLVRDSDRIR